MGRFQVYNLSGLNGIHPVLLQKKLKNLSPTQNFTSQFSTETNIQNLGKKQSHHK